MIDSFIQIIEWMMEKLGKFLLICVMFSLMFTFPLAAQEDAGQAGNFLRYGVGGRALGMGRAFVSLADDASGVYWNPAGILGVKRVEIATMYTDLYWENQYTHLGLVIPRPGKRIRDKVGNFLIGDGSAIGFGWIGLNSTGFEQRTRTGEYLGDFGLGENALLFSWAREEVGSWGIFRYGVTFKFVNQNFTGLQSVSDSEPLWADRDWSGGIDFGMTFQPFHAPIFSILPLRYLLPLKLGVVFQNITQPSWRGADETRDKFPRIWRAGASYRFVLRDWFPGAALKRFFGRSHILASFDFEQYANKEDGYYFGIEGFFPITPGGAAFYPRYGTNNRGEGPVVGAGLALPFGPSALFRFDYAYRFHPDLPEDNRFFVTLQMGQNMGPGYFLQASEREEMSRREVRKYLLRVLSEYPNDYIFDTVNKLATLEDSVSARRYYDLTGGVGRAGWLFAEAKSMLKAGRVDRARDKADDATSEYAPVFSMPDRSMNDDELLNYGESLVIANRLDEALPVLESVQRPNLRTFFLLGTCRKVLQDYDTAIEMFRNALKRYEVEQDRNSMVHLSFLGLGESLIQKEQYESAITTFDAMLKERSYRLDSNYPRYPIFWDEYAVDDAQFLTGCCTIKMSNYEDGVSMLLQTQRMYPTLEYGRFVEERAAELIGTLDNANWSRLDELADQFLAHYFRNHNLLEQ